MLRRKKGEMMPPGSEVLPQMTGGAGSDMHSNHHSRIAGMKKKRDPYDTA
jgi:hypothetical protein